MVKAAPPSLQQRYKPWRRGKSKHNANKGSLKHQLRGLQRLLKQPRQDDPSHAETIQTRIQELEIQIANKQVIAKETERAKSSHKCRFLERQKLTRQLSQATTAADTYKLALDLAYVAHFPLSQSKYIPLFQQGQRRVDTAKLLHKRARLRTHVVEQLHAVPHKPWIPEALYELLPPTWSVEQEMKVFGVLQERKSDAKHDERFAGDATRDALLKAAAQAEQQADRELKNATKSRKSSDGSCSTESSNEEGSHSSSSDDKADALTEPTTTATARPQQQQHLQGADLPHKDDMITTSSSDSENSSSSSSRSTSDSSSTRSSDNNASEVDLPSSSAPAPHQPTRTNPTVGAQSPYDDDDFLVAANDDDDDDDDVFAQAHPVIDVARGDKSQGWATQRQRPMARRKKPRTRY